MGPRRLLIFHEHPLPQANPLLSSPETPQTPYHYAAGVGSAQPPGSQYQYQYTPINKLGLPITGPGSTPEALGLGSLLSLPLRVINAFTEIFNGVKYKGWAIVAAGQYSDPSFAVSPGPGGGTGKFYAVVLEQVDSSASSGGSGSGGGIGVGGS